MMSSTTAQRRGKGGVSSIAPPLVVEHEHHHHVHDEHHHEILLHNKNGGSDNNTMMMEMQKLLPGTNTTTTVATAMGPTTTGIMSSSSSTNTDMMFEGHHLQNLNSTTNNNNGANLNQHTTIVKVATVRRNYCGTGPFDQHWLNMDCCGLFCACLTYGLHLYAWYCVCFVLLPPWMSYYTTTNATNANISQHTQQQPQQHQQQRHMTLMGYWNQLTFTTLTLLAIFAHFRAMTTDPGAVPPDAKPLSTITTTTRSTATSTSESSSIDNNHNKEQLYGEFMNQHPGESNTTATTTSNTSNDPMPRWNPNNNNYNIYSNNNSNNSSMEDPLAMKRLCRRCRAYKPNRAHHCSICRRCIIKMDHHCPWVNNCVGIGNHKFFLLFIFYTWLTCMFSIVLIVARFSTCSITTRYHGRFHHEQGQQQQYQQHYTSSPSCLDQPTALMHILFLLVEGLLFGMFTGCMMTDQSEVVASKLTHIDRLKGTHIGGSLGGFTEVFGVGPRGVIDTRFRTDWLSPFVRVCFPPSVHDEVMGYCRPIGQIPGIIAPQSVVTSGAPNMIEPTGSTTTTAIRAGRYGADIV